MAKSGSSILFAAAIGLAAGIGVGLLIAPAKGSKTRKRLKKRLMGLADLMQDDLSEKLHAFKSALSSEEEDDLPEDAVMMENGEGK